MYLGMDVMFKCAILKPFRVSSLFLFKGHSFKIVSLVDSGVLTGVNMTLSKHVHHRVHRPWRKHRGGICRFKTFWM